MGAPETYQIRLYDTPVATFRFRRNAFGEAEADGLETDPALFHLLPLNIMESPTSAELSRWLETRRVPKNRAYVEQLLAPFGIALNDTKAIIDATKGVSINDSYSVLPEGDPSRFADYNLFENDFDEALQYIAYTGGVPPEAVGSGIPSELSPSGSFPKTWRVVEGRRVLYKAGSAIKASNTGKEPYSELFAWQVARAMGLDAVPYDVTCWNGEVCSTCELFNSKDVSFVPFGYALCRETFASMNLERALAWFEGIDAERAAASGAEPSNAESAAERFKSMLVFDGIVANPDRHLGNYGILRDNRTGAILGLAPVFDNNLSLFTHEFTRDLTPAFMEERLRRAPGAFGPTLQQQAHALLGDAQREQVARLRGFGLEPTAFVREWAAAHNGQASAFPEARARILSGFIQKRVEDLLQ